MVHPKEVQEVFTPDPRNCREFPQNHFVRLRRGAYAGDLGLIKKIDSDSTNVLVMVVPRLRPRKARKPNKPAFPRSGDPFIDDGIDVGAIDTPAPSEMQARPRKKKVALDSKGRPRPRLFDPADFDKDDYTEVDLLGRRSLGASSQRRANVFYRWSD